MDVTNNNFHKINISNDIKSIYILKQIFYVIDKAKLYHIIKYNKNLRNKLNTGQKYFEDLLKIEIEVIPHENKYGQFINENIDKGHFKIYFDNNKEEIKETSIKQNHNIKKIKIIIDKEVKSLNKLFQLCRCIKEINFIKFYRNDITDMNSIFSNCESLQAINFMHFNTKNVTSMQHMFFQCKSLLEINLTNFNTKKVTEMYNMFNALL